MAHPVWGTFPVKGCRLDFDFAAVYGPEWGFLTGAAPCSTVLAAGPDVAVFPEGKLMR